tara:strand:+ start:1567 stop:1992 length:426 start_codon:yes stop_codon:yes gene_type:complete
MNLSFLHEDDISIFENDKTLLAQPIEPIFQTFNVNCKTKLSAQAKQVLLSWKGKPFYCANEDILYLFKFDLVEQDFLLKTLHSMGIFLQNATCANLFDISIYNVKITPSQNKQSSSEFSESITFKLKCHVITPSQKSEVAW